jgi:hypothetical protein
VLQELEWQNGFVRGKDRDGRAILIIRSRTHGVENEDDFILTQLYNVERAIAATEYDSCGVGEMFTVVFDFGSFDRSVAPSLGVVKQLASILESSYSDRLKLLIITDPPLWMRSLWMVIKPFLHPDTREKFVLANGEKKKVELIGPLVDKEHAMKFMLPTGRLSADVDIVRFVKDVPFFLPYD